MGKKENWWDVWEEPDKRFTLEKPIVGRTWMLDSSKHHLPETDIQALMEAEPNQEPKTSKEHLLQEMDWILEAIEQLDETEQAVAECTLIAGHSVRTAAEILGMRKSTVADYKKRVQEKLTEMLENNE